MLTSVKHRYRAPFRRRRRVVGFRSVDEKNKYFFTKHLKYLFLSTKRRYDNVILPKTRRYSSENSLSAFIQSLPVPVFSVRKRKFTTLK